MMLSGNPGDNLLNSIDSIMTYFVAFIALEYGKVLQSVPGCSDYISIDVQCKIWACADSRTNSKAKTGSSRGVPISANKLPVNPCYNQ